MIERAGWGILGTGKIARIFAADLRGSASGRLQAVGSRDAARASAFATEFGAARAYGGYDDVLADPDVDFVYVATPHPTHERLAIDAARAGKHVLCEKPLAVDAAGARRMVEAAHSAGTFLMEAFAFRCHPQSQRLADLIADGAIGEVRSVNSAFGYDGGPAPTNYLLRHDLAGGSILDVGCYTASLTRQVAGMASGAPFADPVSVVGVGVLHPEARVDLDAAALASFAGGITGQLSCSIRTNLESSVLITGTRGRIRIPAPWLPGKHGGPPRLLVEGVRRDADAIESGDPRDLYAIEADTVVDHVRAGRQQAPEMGWADSIGNMELLDRWRSAIGYDLGDLGQEGAVAAMDLHR